MSWVCLSMSPALEANVAMLAKAMYMIQEGSNRAYACVSLRPRSDEDGLAYVIKTEIATGCAKSDAKDDQKRGEGHPDDGEEREPVPAHNMVTV
jgi:hypothetical protein